MSADIIQGTQPYTRDWMEPVPLHDIVFPVVDGVVTIPTVNGDAVVTLNQEGKRKDWFYEMRYKGGRFIFASWEYMLEAIDRVIRKEELRHAQR